MNGWLKVHRKLVEWEWYRDSAMVHLFIHLLLNASNRDCKWKGVDVKRGQVVVGRKKLSLDTGISEKSIRTCLNRLESSSVTASKPTNKYTIVTILNYDEYQAVEEGGGQQTGQQMANKGPAKGQQKATSEEGKEVEKVKKEDISSGKEARPPVPYVEIISFLNEKVGGKFKASTQSTKTKIKARWNEGFTLDDFRTVIEHKADEWLTDERFVQYLRPETLFGPKFEGYLQAAASQQGDGGGKLKINMESGLWSKLVKAPS